jgi:hypothetical protein
VADPVSHSSVEPPRSLAKANQRISSLEKNPASGGSPAIAAVAMAKVTKVTGIFLARPPIFRRSCSPDSAWMTLPAPRNRQALKNACVVRWNTATP